MINGFRKRAREAIGVQPMRTQHFVVLAATRKIREAKTAHRPGFVGLHFRNSGSYHFALTARNELVVEQKYRTAAIQD
jgi:hypothetical protein